MRTPADIEAKHQDARTLPAPPAALWTFVVLFTVSVAFAIVNG